MKCKVCDMEFEGDFCPACATPAEKSKHKSHRGFYKDPWFWISFMLFICLIINPVKEYIGSKNVNLSSRVTQNTVSGFFENSFESNTSVISSAESESFVSSSAAYINSESPSEIELTDSTTVYTTPNGKRYHLSAKCAGKNATATNVEKAKNEEKTPCKKCIKQSKD